MKIDLCFGWTLVAWRALLVRGSEYAPGFPQYPRQQSAGAFTRKANMQFPRTNDLIRMDRSELLRLWSVLMNEAPPRRLSTPFLKRFLAFELQSKQSGGLSRKLAKRIGQIESGEFQTTSPKLKPGGRLIREWNGVAHIVDVTGEGFVWNGRSYRSLSAIARDITGAHWSGPRFFNIKKQTGK